MSRRPATALALGMCALLVGACSTRTSTASRDALRALDVAATTTTVAAGPATTAPACGNPVASLRPSGPLPAPGAMPAGSLMATIQARGKLIVGVDQTTFLFGYLNPSDGQIEGFDIDMLRQVAKAIFGDDGQNENSRLQFTAISSAQRIPFVRDSKVDIVARTTTINCSRKVDVSFSTVYYDAGQKVLVRADSPIAGSKDIGGKKVCATSGSTSVANMIDVTKTHAASPAIPVPVTDWTDCLVALQSGTVDAVSTDDTILAGLANQDAYTKIVGAKFTDEPYGMIINKSHPEFVRFVNGMLERIRSDGTWAGIWSRWLSKVYGATPAPPPATYQD